jgi:hypothetical protein
MSLVKANRQANFKGFKRFGAFKGLVEQKNVVFNSFHSRFKMAHACQKRPNLHTNELNTTFFCSTSPLKTPNRLKPLKLA